jgi:hypothetical protein
VREQLVQAFEQRAPCTWQAVLPLVGVNPRSRSEVVLVRRTVENMKRAGELVHAGRDKAAGSRVWRAMYELAARADGQAAGWAQAATALDGVTRRWTAVR